MIVKSMEVVSDHAIMRVPEPTIKWEVAVVVAVADPFYLGALCASAVRFVVEKGGVDFSSTRENS